MITVTSAGNLVLAKLLDFIQQNKIKIDSYKSSYAGCMEAMCVLSTIKINEFFRATIVETTGECPGRHRQAEGQAPFC